jgi:hypothetical protein
MRARVRARALRRCRARGRRFRRQRGHHMTARAFADVSPHARAAGVATHALPPPIRSDDGRRRVHGTSARACFC